MFEKSEKAFDEAKKVLPGGVNSPVRAFKSVNMNPVFMKSGKGVYLTDIDDNQYIDYVLSWGPQILGHADDDVISAITKTAANGTSFGAPTELETELAELVISRVPSVEVVRMVNSGTEATMSALRLARGATGRDKILKFEGSYHGHADSLLIKAGSGVATLGLPDSPGVPDDIAKNTLTVPYNDVDSLKLAFEHFGDEIAAVIVEPVAGNMGTVLPTENFMQNLRKITEDFGSLLIFDEVMTGFRVAYDCAQGYFGIKPDLTCFGKIIGGGLPVGAYGGRRDLMEQIAPAGPIYQAGTLSGNPLAMSAGLATLSKLKPSDYRFINGQAEKLAGGLRELAVKFDISVQINHVGGMFTMFFAENEVTNFETAKKADLARFSKFFGLMLEQGIYLPASQFETWFLSTLHTDDIIAKTLSAAEKAFGALK